MEQFRVLCVCQKLGTKDHSSFLAQTRERAGVLGPFLVTKTQVPRCSFIFEPKACQSLCPGWHVIRQYMVEIGLAMVAKWAYAGTFAVAVRFQNQDQFWVSHQKIRGHFFIFPESRTMSSHGQNGVFDNFQF